MSQSRILRERGAIASAALDRSAEYDPFGSASYLAVTTTIAAYPAVAAAYYAINIASLVGVETEGAGDTPVIDTTTTVFALNVGTQVPPEGMAVVAHAVGNRWVFRYDG